jgi:hypothetical protein
LRIADCGLRPSTSSGRPEHVEGRIDRLVARRIAFAALGFRLLSAFLAFLCNIVFPLDRPEQFSVFNGASPFWDTFARYDTGYFEKIAWGGYAPLEGGRSNIAYFPVYPMLMRLVGQMFGRRQSTFYISGIAVSWVCFIASMVALYYLARLDLPRRRAERAVLLAAIFPFAFFFGVAYSESTFLLFTVLAFYFIRRERYIAGGICGGIATATRVPGIFMVPALAWIAFEQLRRGQRSGGVRGSAGSEVGGGQRSAGVRGWWPAIGGVILASSGFLAYCAYIYSLTGNPLEWAATLQRWGYYPGGAPWLAPFRLIANLATHPYAYLAGDRMAPYDTLYGVTGIAFVAATPFVWRRFGGGYGLFMLANLWLPLSSGVFEGVGRYCSVLFPFFIWTAEVKSRTLATALIVIFALFYTLGLALFTTIHPLF